MAASGPLRPLWTCPRCGKLFANRNNWHSCAVWPFEYHFEGKVGDQEHEHQARRYAARPR